MRGVGNNEAIKESPGPRRGSESTPYRAASLDDRDVVHSRSLKPDLDAYCSQAAKNALINSENLLSIGLYVNTKSQCV